MANFALSPNRLLPPGHHTSHRVVILAGIIISFFVIILALTIANSRSSFFGRAASTPNTARRPGDISVENSYLFASPISAASDSTSIIRITVILLSDTGLGVGSQQVILKAGSTNVKIAQTQPMTDTFGRAIFDATSSTPGNYTISAEVSGVSLPATVSIVFR